MAKAKNQAKTQEKEPETEEQEEKTEMAADVQDSGTDEPTEYKDVPHGQQTEVQRMSMMNDFIRETNEAKTTVALNKLYDTVVEWYGNEKAIPSNLYIVFKKRADFLENGGKTYVPNVQGTVPHPPEDERKWKKVTHEQALAADRAGKLAGYDRRRGLAYIND